MFRLTAVSEYPKPKNAKALKRYLGLMNWFKKFIQNYSAVANPLYKLLRKDVKVVPDSPAYVQKCFFF